MTTTPTTKNGTRRRVGGVVAGVATSEQSSKPRVVKKKSQDRIRNRINDSRSIRDSSSKPPPEETRGRASTSISTVNATVNATVNVNVNVNTNDSTTRRTGSANGDATPASDSSSDDSSSDDSSSDDSSDDNDNDTSSANVQSMLGPFDVLMGRGIGVARHPGNVHFRALVDTARPHYQGDAYQRHKMAIACDVLTAIARRGGRFVKHHHHHQQQHQQQQPAAVWWYRVVSHATAYAKTTQALRTTSTSTSPVRHDEIAQASANRHSQWKPSPPTAATTTTTTTTTTTATTLQQETESASTSRNMSTTIGARTNKNNNKLVKLVKRSPLPPPLPLPPPPRHSRLTRATLLLAKKKKTPLPSSLLPLKERGPCYDHPCSTLVLAEPLDPVHSIHSKAAEKKGTSTTTATTTATTPTTMSSNLSPYDVLLGRGPTIAKHSGNVHFRALVEAAASMAKPESVKRKEEIVQTIATAIWQQGGRFVKVDDVEDAHVVVDSSRSTSRACSTSTSTAHHNKKTYSEVTEDRALVKIRRALRDWKNPVAASNDPSLPLPPPPPLLTNCQILSCQPISLLRTTKGGVNAPPLGDEISRSIVAVTPFSPILEMSSPVPVPVSLLPLLPLTGNHDDVYNHDDRIVDDDVAVPRRGKTILPVQPPSSSSATTGSQPPANSSMVRVTRAARSADKKQDSNTITATIQAPSVGNKGVDVPDSDSGEGDLILLQPPPLPPPPHGGSAALAYKQLELNRDFDEVFLPSSASSSSSVSSLWESGPNKRYHQQGGPLQQQQQQQQRMSTKPSSLPGIIMMMTKAQHTIEPSNWYTKETPVSSLPETSTRITRLNRASQVLLATPQQQEPMGIPSTVLGDHGKHTPEFYDWGDGAMETPSTSPLSGQSGCSTTDISCLLCASLTFQSCQCQSGEWAPPPAVDGPPPPHSRVMVRHSSSVHPSEDKLSPTMTFDMTHIEGYTTNMPLSLEKTLSLLQIPECDSENWSPISNLDKEAMIPYSSSSGTPDLEEGDTGMLSSSGQLSIDVLRELSPPPSRMFASAFYQKEEATTEVTKAAYTQEAVSGGIEENGFIEEEEEGASGRFKCDVILPEQSMTPTKEESPCREAEDSPAIRNPWTPIDSSIRGLLSSEGGNVVCFSSPGMKALVSDDTDPSFRRSPSQQQTNSGLAPSFSSLLEAARSPGSYPSFQDDSGLKMPTSLSIFNKKGSMTMPGTPDESSPSIEIDDVWMYSELLPGTPEQQAQYSSLISNNLATPICDQSSWSPSSDAQRVMYRASPFQIEAFADPTANRASRRVSDANTDDRCLSSL